MKPLLVWSLVVVVACNAPSQSPGDASIAVPDTSPLADARTDASIDAPIDAPVEPLGDPWLALQAMSGSCSSDKWCWQWAHPMNNDYSGLSSSSPDNIWLIAGHGTVLQWDGHTWAAHHPPVVAGDQLVQNPRAIAGTAARNMWLIYGRTVQYWDGATWTILDVLPATGNPQFTAVWTDPTGTPWVTLSNGIVKHWHNGSWQLFDVCGGCFIGSIWGVAADDFFVSALPSSIYHYDGVSFTQIYSGPHAAGFFVGAKDDVWVSGGDGFVTHWNGTAFTTVPTGGGLAGWAMQPIAYLARDDVWWWAKSSLLHWNGASIEVTPVTTDAFPLAMAIIDGRWWFAGRDGVIYTRSGPDTLAPVVGYSPAHSTSAMWGPSGDDMYFATFSDSIHHWNGTTMTEVPIRAQAIGGARTAGVDELFAAGSDRVGPDLVTNGFHFDGTTWIEVELERRPFPQSPPAISVIHAMRAGEAMGVGTQGVAYHFAHGTWQRVATGTTEELVGVWGPDPDHLWITGMHGTVLAWSSMNPDVATIDPTFPSTADDLGPVHGADGVTWIGVTTLNGDPTRPMYVFRHTAAGWTTVVCPVAATALFATSANDVVVSSGGSPDVARWNGTGFIREDASSAISLPVLFRPPGGPMFAATSRGVVAHP